MLSEEDWEELRERLWFKPKALNHSADPYELPETTLPMLKGAYSLEYKDFYGNVLRYYEQFFQSGEFCKGSIFEIVFKESEMVLLEMTMKVMLSIRRFIVILR